jgi:uncharacterized protein YjiS (DUF1127 family)
VLHKVFIKKRNRRAFTVNKASSAPESLHVLEPRATEWPWPNWFRDLAPTIARLWEKRRERQLLLELDDHLLNDIGITHQEAEAEAAKWPWQ